MAVWNFKGYNDFIGNLTPAERILGNKIIGDPAYFSLRVPRRFTDAKLTLKYKVDSGISIIEAGVLTGVSLKKSKFLPVAVRGPRRAARPANLARGQ